MFDFEAENLNFNRFSLYDISYLFYLNTPNIFRKKIGKGNYIFCLKI